MKRHTASWLFFVLMVAGHAGAAQVVPPNVQEAAQQKPASKKEERTPEPAAPARQSTALFAMGFDVLEKSRQDNPIVSPYSIAGALGILKAGAKGTTASEIAQVLGEAPSDAGQSSALTAIRKALQDSHAGVAIVEGNRVWVDQSAAASIRPDYMRRLADSAAGDIAPVAFAQPTEAADIINQWISTTTQGHIKNLVSAGTIPRTTKLVATNAVYFKGTWSQPFNKNATSMMPFYFEGVRSVDVATMAGEVSVWEATVQDNYIAEVPFGSGEFALLLVLPIPSLANDGSLNLAKLKALPQWRMRLRAANVKLELPRWHIAPIPVSVEDSLQTLGLKSAFGPQADFSGITGHTDLVLDGVYHAADITVDEEGAEATAATVAVMRSLHSRVEIPVRQINRPFLFAIVHRASGVPMFMGILRRPRAS